ncbi:MAG: hypothetical protein J7L37_02275 [Thermococcus sp.]|nr:hypothetical protein [Thermococcus sp.]
MKEVFEKIKTEYGIEIENENDMTGAWKLVETLKERGWVVYIITAKGREQVDAWHPSYGSLYAQFGEIPNFRNLMEGICLTSLRIRELEKNGTL